MARIVLASRSPRRAEYIKLLGIDDVEIIASKIEETVPENMSPADTVCSLALQKAEAVAAQLAPDLPLIIAADTLVYLDGRPLGKPVDFEDAKAMLKLLSGRCHSVYTGIVLLRGDRYMTDAEKTDVWFREMTEKEIDGYIATGEPMDKAGAYGAQGRAAVFIERIDGDFWNVAGLPLCRLSVMMREFAPQSG